MLNFILKYIPMFVILDGIGHHMNDKPGSSLVFMMFPLSFVIFALICKQLILKKVSYQLFMENHFVAMTLLMLTFTITESGIYLNPDQFKIITRKNNNSC